MYFFSAPPLAASFQLPHGFPNTHLGWVCSRLQGFHLNIYLVRLYVRKGWFLIVK